jgi:hypothetical protein
MMNTPYNSFNKPAGNANFVQVTKLEAEQQPRNAGNAGNVGNAVMNASPQKLISVPVQNVVDSDEETEVMSTVSSEYIDGTDGDTIDTDADTDADDEDDSDADADVDDEEEEDAEDDSDAADMVGGGSGSDSDAETSSTVSTAEILGRDPLFLVLSEFLMDDEGNNIVHILSKINKNLSKLTKALESNKKKDESGKKQKHRREDASA